MEISQLNGYVIKDKKAIRYYNTVADMVNDTTLKAGMHVKTSGYYASHDGGNAEYKIIDDNTLIPDNGTIILLNNNLFAKQIVEYPINVKKFGVKGDNSNDDTTIIQALLEKYKYLYFPNGNYKITNIILKNGCTIIGESKDSTKFIADNNTIGYMFSTYPSGTIRRIEIKNITIDCNSVANGIYIGDHLTGVVYNSRHLIDNVLILSPLNYGIEDESMGSTFNNINVNGQYAENTTAIGGYFHGTDSFISNCRFEQCNNDGLKISGVNYQIINCKSMTNKGNGGTLDNCAYLMVENTVFEENGKNGLYVNICNDSKLNIKCGANGTSAIDLYAELFVDTKVRNCNFYGILEPYSNQGKARYGIKVNDDYDYNNIFNFMFNMAHNYNYNFSKISAPSYLTNKFIINNKEFTYKDENKLFTDTIEDVGANQPSAITSEILANKNIKYTVDISSLTASDIRLRIYLPTNTKNYSIKFTIDNASYNKIIANQGEKIYDTATYTNAGGSHTINNFNTSFVDRTTIDYDNKVLCFTANNLLDEPIEVTERYLSIVIDKTNLIEDLEILLKDIQLTYETV